MSFCEASCPVNSLKHAQRIRSFESGRLNFEPGRTEPTYSFSEGGGVNFGVEVMEEEGACSS